METKLDRRTFLQGSLLAALTAINPFAKDTEAISRQPAWPSLVRGGFHDHIGYTDRACYDYAVSQGVLFFGDSEVPGTPGALFTDLAMTVTVMRGDEAHARTAMLFQSLIGPTNVIKHGYDRFGDAKRVVKNNLVLGLGKSDDTTLWLRFPNTIITSIGVSMTVAVESSSNNSLIVTEMVILQAGEPVIIERPSFILPNVKVPTCVSPLPTPPAAASPASTPKQS